jgi:hypothetical protein
MKYNRLINLIKIITLYMNALDVRLTRDLDTKRYYLWRGLLGFMKREAGQNIAKNFDPDGLIDESDFSEKLNEARNYVEEKLKERKILSPKIEDIDENNKRITKLYNEPTFKEHTIGMLSRYKVAMVELGKLHVFQPFLNEEYIDELSKKFEKLNGNDEEALFKFCLPLREEVEKHLANASFNPVTNTFSLVTENLDLRIIGNVNGTDPITGRTFFGFAFGSGLPQMSIVKFKDFYFIKNGYHRAFALYKKKVKSAPFIVLETDQFINTGANQPGFFDYDTIYQYSPILEDFDSKAALILPRRRLRAILSIHGEIQFLPI